MMKTKKETEVSKLIVGMYTAFPRAQMISEGTLGIWVFSLKDYPIKSLRAAVSRWINTKDWPPDNLNKFVSAVAGTSFTKREEPDPPGYKEFIREYRAEGMGRGPRPEHGANENEPPTVKWKAGIHWRLIRDIVDRKVVCPAAIKKGDVYATDDPEERWYWAEFEKRVREARDG